MVWKTEYRVASRARSSLRCAHGGGKANNAQGRTTQNLNTTNEEEMIGDKNMTATVIDMRSKQKPAQLLRCSKCGAKTEAACDCGVGYEPARVVAAKAVKANPEKSNRAIAAELGIHHDTVREARKSVAGFPATDRRIGTDGKSYPATKPDVGKVVSQKHQHRPNWQTTKSERYSQVNGDG